MAPGRSWLVLAVAAGCVVLGGCGGGMSAPQTRAVAAGSTSASLAPTTTGSSTPATTASSTPAASAGTTGSVAASTSAPRPRRRPSGPNPGTLPQTTQLPSGDTPGFKAEMAALWRAISDGAVGPGMPAFFPETAYVQVKTIGDPQADYRGRLIVDYALDIGAAHALLGANARSAQLLAVNVPQAYAHWVPPGVCDNGVGYYEVPNSRLVYRAGGEVRSLGIASMISWRGVWYVVHLGAVLRAADAGVVDDPSQGPGASIPSSTC